VNKMTSLFITSFSGSFSVHIGRIILMINGEEHDISHLFPKHNYSHDELNHPEINWKIRVKMAQNIKQYVVGIDPTFDVDSIIV